MGVRARLVRLAAGLLLGIVTCSACGDPPGAGSSSPPKSPADKLKAKAINVPEEDADTAFDDGLVLSLLKQREQAFAPMLAAPKQYRLQILYSEVRKENGKTRLVRHGYRVDAEYFYPASAIKLGLAVGALEALHDSPRVKKRKVDFSTPARFRDYYTGNIEERDPTDTVTGRMTIGHEIKKLLLVSDNQSYNRLYSFLGQREATTRMWKLGLTSVRLRHRLGGLPVPGDDPRITPEVTLLPPGEEPLVIPETKSDLPLGPNDATGVLVGSSHIAPSGAKIEGPLSFAEKNAISLQDIQDLLIKVVRPDLSTGPLPQLTPKDKELLANALGTRPSLSKNPSFEGGAALDDLHKPMLQGLTRAFPQSRVFVYSKAGRAYGFSVENAYVLFPNEKKSFFVAAVLYTNDNGVVGDDKYPYNEVAIPFFANLGEVLSRHAIDANPQ